MKEKLEYIQTRPFPGRGTALIVQLSGGGAEVLLSEGADSIEVCCQLERLVDLIAKGISDRAGVSRPNVANCRPESP